MHRTGTISIVLFDVDLAVQRGISHVALFSRITCLYRCSQNLGIRMYQSLFFLIALMLGFATLKCFTYAVAILHIIKAIH